MSTVAPSQVAETIRKTTMLNLFILGSIALLGLGIALELMSLEALGYQIRSIGVALMIPVAYTLFTRLLTRMADR